MIRSALRYSVTSSNRRASARAPRHEWGRPKTRACATDRGRRHSRAHSRSRRRQAISLATRSLRAARAPASTPRRPDGHRAQATFSCGVSEPRRPVESRHSGATPVARACRSVSPCRWLRARASSFVATAPIRTSRARWVSWCGHELCGATAKSRGVGETAAGDDSTPSATSRRTSSCDPSSRWRAAARHRTPPAPAPAQSTRGRPRFGRRGSTCTASSCWPYRTTRGRRWRTPSAARSSSSRAATSRLRSRRGTVRMCVCRARGAVGGSPRVQRLPLGVDRDEV